MIYMNLNEIKLGGLVRFCMRLQVPTPHFIFFPSSSPLHLTIACVTNLIYFKRTITNNLFILYISFITLSRKSFRYE